MRLQHYLNEANDECWMEGPVLMLINDNVTLDYNLEDFLRGV